MDFFSRLKKIILKSKSVNKPIVSHNFDLKLIKKRKKFPNWEQIKNFKKILSPFEKKIVNFSLLILFFSFCWLVVLFFGQYRVSSPARGGSYIEADVGSPNLINPLFASLNETDMDITQLVFSGLVHLDNKQRIVPDLAAKYSVSEDKKEYVFELKKDVVWHDGEKFTAKDVVFTFESILNPAVSSPLNLSFQGVTVQAIDDYTVKFTLTEPYSKFLSSLTVGILPEHLWYDIQPEQMRFAQYNLSAIGTGPFKFKKLTKDETGRIYKYELQRFEQFYRQPAYLDNFTFQFFAEYDGDSGAVQALREKKVSGLNYVPFDLVDKVERKFVDVHKLRLPQYTSLFLNQDHSSFLKEKKLRMALAYALDKDRIVREVLKNDAQVIYSPILPDFPGYSTSTEKTPYSPEEANKFLDAKWPRFGAEEYYKSEKEKLLKVWFENNKNTSSTTSTLSEEELKNLADKEVEEQLKELKNSPQIFYRKDKDSLLELTLVTVDNEQYKKTAQLIVGFWQDIGIKVNLKFVSSKDLTRDILKTRDYDILLYGTILGSDPDPYPFWHSSQIDYPGVNLSRYINRNLDSAIEKIRAAKDESEVLESYKTFQKILLDDYAAIFLYMPTYTYATLDEIKGMTVERISKPSDRFLDVTNWYIKTKGKWSFSSK